MRIRAATPAWRITARGSRHCRGCCAPRQRSKRTAHKFLIPTLHFQLGPAQVKKGLFEAMRRIGVTRRANDHAADAAYAAQREFQDKLLEAGRQAPWRRWNGPASRAWCWPGRGYNIYDRSMNCDIPRKLRHRYGANVIPLDFLVTGREPAADAHAQHVLDFRPQDSGSGAPGGARAPNLHLVYITNFKCGPDSYIKHFAREAAGAPLLVLQFDGHGNDAGYMTRCEAYLDSKGILRCYQSSTEPPPRTPNPPQASIH